MTENEVLRQAEWTPSTAVERDVEYRRRLVMGHDWMALTVGAFLITAFCIVGICASVIYLGGLSFIPIIGLLVGSFLLALRIDRRRDRLQAEAIEADRILRDEFGSGDGWLVNLKILQGAAPSGEDRGILWLEDGRLIFSGHRTSFALSQGQVIGHCEYVSKIPGLRHSWSLRLSKVTEAGPVSLSFEPEANVTSLAPGVNQWLKTKPTEDGQFPPTVLGPGAPHVDRLLAGAVASASFWLILAYLVVHAPTPNAMVLIATVGCIVGYFLRVWFPFTRWRAWMDLRRLYR